MFVRNVARISVLVLLCSPLKPAQMRLLPEADTTIKESRPDRNFGFTNSLKADRGGNQNGHSGKQRREDFLLKFAVSGVGDSPVTSAILLLYSANRSDHGGDFYSCNSNWEEDRVTWASAPSADRFVGSLGPVVSTGMFLDVDLSSIITQDGVYCFRVTSNSPDAVGYASKEEPDLAPQLHRLFRIVFAAPFGNHVC